MRSAIHFEEKKTPRLERFGIYYLTLFGKKTFNHHVFDFSDQQLKNKVRLISAKGICLSAFTGLLLVWPTIYVDVFNENQPFLTHYLWLAGVTLMSMALELYLLFIIALSAVHEVSELINMHAYQKHFMVEGPFNITSILARAALELPDPELLILGIDPFEKVSKKNLLILGLLYKLKITLTNLMVKYLLLATAGRTILGTSVKYMALPVECFWNAVMIHRVVKEARLRLFGFALSHHIADLVLQDHLLDNLSEEAKIGCLRAIGNAVVMAQSYHPNMMVLLIRFQELLYITGKHQYDDWGLFLQTLKQVKEKERFFLLNLFTIAVAFDGRISRLEAGNIQDAYGNEYHRYHPRLMLLTKHMKAGRLHAAADLCKIDFSPG